jgi:hypothetical protein
LHFNTPPPLNWAGKMQTMFFFKCNWVHSRVHRYKCTTDF